MESSDSEPPKISLPYIRDIPRYGQHPNGCGLSSLLMLLNPPENPEIESFLNKAWETIGKLYSDRNFPNPEDQWAIVLQYILLKCLGYAQKDDLYEFLNKRMDYVMEDQRIITKFTVQQDYQRLVENKHVSEAYTYLHYLEDHDFILPILLFKQLHTMKTDIELKVLCELFNFEFKFQESEDFTGATYFDEKEIGLKVRDSALKKWKVLETLIKDPSTIAFWGKAHHWLAIRGIYHLFPGENSETVTDQTDLDPYREPEFWKGDMMIIDCNDPASVTQVQHQFRELKTSDRFYVFQHRANTNLKILNRILEYIEDDAIEEEARWQKYLAEQEAKQAAIASTPTEPLSEDQPPELVQSVPIKPVSVEIPNTAEIPRLKPKKKSNSKKPLDPWQ